jgi:hypothetical protein
MDTDPKPFNPEGLQLSKLRFYSTGIVASDKKPLSPIIEVTPTEVYPMLDGEIDSAQTDTSENGVGFAGDAYSVSTKTANSLQAEWLRLGYGNRRTAPDVRRGAEVVIYQFGDADKYYWTTMKDDYKLRKLETAIYAWTGTKDEGVENDFSNSYFLEISTHGGLVTFHTSKANGEFCTYDVQINAKDGKIVVQDDIGNSFLLDSRNHQLRLENTDGSVLDLTRTIATLTTRDAINMSTKDFTLKSETGDFGVQAMTVHGDTLKTTTADVSFNNSAFTVVSGATDIT